LSIAKPLLIAGVGPTDERPRSDPFRAADFISRAVSDRGLHQTLIEARSGDADAAAVTRAENGSSPRPRNSSVPSCRPTQYGGLWSAAPVPVRSQLGRGAAHSGQDARGRGEDCRASTGGQSSRRTRDVRGPDANARSGPHRDEWHRRRTWSHRGSVRRQALPCPSIAFSQSGSASAPQRHGSRLESRRSTG